MTETVVKSKVGIEDFNFGTGTFVRPTSTGGSSNITKLGAIWESLLDDQTAALVMSTLGISAFAQTLLDDANAGAARTTLGVIASAFITDGDIEIDGDKLDIDWSPSNYTPATTPTEVDDADNLTAHLYGIDQELASLDDYRFTASAKTADYTLAAADLYGTKVFTNDAAAGAINFTWPTLVAGQAAEFYVSDAQYLKITAPTGKSFRHGADTGAAAGYIRCNTVGGHVRISVNTTDNLSVTFLSDISWTVDE